MASCTSGKNQNQTIPYQTRPDETSFRDLKASTRLEFLFVYSGYRENGLTLQEHNSGPSLVQGVPWVYETLLQ
ncbi:hypothetical protein M0802_009914 [Mischocyttarus mexicanus]|nr:hypothetical protein M0802_009914 [Mischocyttarus mexicanus]